MSEKVAELTALMSQEGESAWVSELWDKFHRQRHDKIEDWKECSNYVTATDTNIMQEEPDEGGHSNTVHVPKIAQIRDNLHSNYLSHLFPNDSWLSWEAYDHKSSTVEKAQAIEGYMRNKTREGGFKAIISKLLYDYIDYGNAFATVDYVTKYREMSDGRRITDYVGPVARRISPMDIEFSPLAESFASNSWNVTRRTVGVGELALMSENEPENAGLIKALDRRRNLRGGSMSGGYSKEDFDKAQSYAIDGYGSMYEYYEKNYVELLTFRGTYYDSDKGILYRDKEIVVADRATVISNRDIPTWKASGNTFHVGWRTRSDNLWSMGPLENLVGLQWRLNHIENLKDDALDLVVNPPLKVIGNVEEFTYGPKHQIPIDEDGDVQELAQSLGGIITATNQVSILMDLMELFAGAPREAMGVRTPGEKTATEVNQLDTAAKRIFQEKINSFETELLEPLLNAMLESGVRNLDEFDVIKTLDKDTHLPSFREITKEDITATGKLRPIGARHFSAQQVQVANMISLFNSRIGELVTPHTDTVKLAEFFEKAINVENFDIFSPNAKIFQDQEAASLAQTGAEVLQDKNTLGQ